MSDRRKLLGSKNALDDLVMLDTISSDKILECLKNRYMMDEIYTNIGPVLIAINPFKMIASNYTDAKIREYRGKKFFELPPHVYALADETYNSMMNYRESQCIIISGESGSGKTETSKFIMGYISGVSGKSVEVVRVKERMLSSNPILEAFGNAKTVNNNNSSRFGKYMEIMFEGGDPVGGRVTNYLLEKSRVVAPAVGERNFHVFYQYCRGASKQQKEAYYLEDPSYFAYLNISNCYDVPGINDVADFKEVQEALGVVGLSEADKAEIFRVIAAVLWLGNLSFVEDGSERSSLADPAVLQYVTALMECDASLLQAALLTRKIQTGVGARAEVFSKPNNRKEAEFCRDTLAKAMYSRLFDYLVRRVNESIMKPNFSGVMIGVLDIYGFEIFQFNSFEQLCINFVNEKLQQIFIELTLKAEQEEYRAEGIPWKDIKYYNNKPICDLIENKPGLLTLLDDCCNTGKTDSHFVQDLGSFFSSNPALLCGSQDFTVKHYAGEVRYVAEGFLTKNKDTLFDDLVIAVKSSKCKFVKDHGWADIEIVEGQKKRPPTVGSMFKGQVTRLMDALRSCVPHYIRCIKPNNEKTPNNFNEGNVSRQVQYLGLVENVRVRRAGYAHRSAFGRFIKRYALLSGDVWSKTFRGDERAQAKHICEAVGLVEKKDFAMGKTKIFIQEATTLFQLEDLVDRKVNEAVVVAQKAWRQYKQKRYFLEVRANSYDLVANKKERRRLSVSRDYQGDYLDAAYSPIISGLLQINGPKEKILFADRSRVVLFKSPSFFAKLFGGKKSDPHESRFLLLSDKALYSFRFEVDPQTHATRAALNARVELNNIASVAVSPFADNYLVVHFAPAANAKDLLLSCRRKTEFLGVLSEALKKGGRGLSLNFVQADSIVVDAQKKRIVEIKWSKDEMAPKETLMQVKHTYDIHIASGVPASQVPAPVRPAAFDPSSVQRTSLKAKFACPGNGIDELTFNAGDIMFMVKEERDGWFEAEFNGKKGFVPASYVEVIRVKRQGGPAVASRAGGAALEQKMPVGFGGLKKKSAWQEVKADDGQIYYWNEQTQQSTWEMPDELKAPAPVPAPVPAPSPARAAFSPGLPGRSPAPSAVPAASAVSAGFARGPGPVPTFGAKPAAVPGAAPRLMPVKAAAIPIARGPGPVPTFGGASAGPAAPVKLPVPAPKLPVPVPAPAKKKCDWVKVHDDDSGHDYYYNEKTQESVWEKPADFW